MKNICINEPTTGQFPSKATHKTQIRNKIKVQRSAMFHVFTKLQLI